jgi:hypothetical protein
MKRFDLNVPLVGNVNVVGATNYAMTPGSFSSDGSQLNGQLTSNGVPVTVTLVQRPVYVGMAGNVEVFTHDDLGDRPVHVRPEGTAGSQ